MARTYKASYCSHGVTTAGDLSILFCEYADAEKLAAGVIESKKLFPGLTTRQTYANKQLLMVITHQDAANAPSTKVEEQRALAIFRAL